MSIHHTFNDNYAKMACTTDENGRRASGSEKVCIGLLSLKVVLAFILQVEHTPWPTLKYQP